MWELLRDNQGFRRYFNWAGNPAGTKEDTTRCVEEVWERGRGIFAHQCLRKRGHGPNSLYCKQHGKNPRYS